MAENGAVSRRSVDGLLAVRRPLSIQDRQESRRTGDRGRVRLRDLLRHDKVSLALSDDRWCLAKGRSKISDRAMAGFDMAVRKVHSRPETIFQDDPS